ncbi:EamA family transporter RarD [Sansalvadorimonas sp. 2012CJ34-2]|uniref:EamA family transporter RarD n=1 Tax=Parendozoicomonas callyspongiae TaxID=2942213 RepID=A0ABT0PJR1_9GAMM|nr:EamA family transporter RarD [Sansalvadorimonas sp. 2012CJ34-2]MCL6271506.1 EamA family transporter RarD [Sansalvadorimonas sp. 2012CJ34-2]
MTTNSPQTRTTTFAVFSTIAAFTIWGLSPVYFKQVAHVSPTEVLAHRVIWSFLLLALVAYVQKEMPVVHQLLKDRKTLLTLTVTAVIIGLNWLVYIWSITNNHIVDASLGYYLNPIVNVLLGMIFLKEKLSPMQKLALLLASAGVAWQVISLGRLPAVSLILAVSFGFYGLIRKRIAAPAVPGLLLETMIMIPLGLGWLLWLAVQGNSAFVLTDFSTCGWLVLAGVITSAPLLLFTSAAPKLRLTTIGFIQYLAPTLALMLGVLMYGEPFGHNLQISFGFIWAALLVFSSEAVLKAKAK